MPTIIRATPAKDSTGLLTRVFSKIPERARIKINGTTG
jgi:hypothetical protein